MSYVPKILIVDDESRMCDSLKVLLGKEGYEIQTRRLGQQAVEALVKEDFDLVLLDLVLPDINGADIMDHINSRTTDTFVIVITGYASLKSAIVSLQKGAFDYLEKPFEEENLLRAVKNALYQKASKRERNLAEEAMRVKDRAIESSINGVAFAEFGGNLTYVNGSFLKLWGYDTDQEVLGRPAVEFWEEPEKALQIVQTLRDEGNWTGELVARKKDGSLFHVEISATMVTDEAGKPWYMMGSFLDITERKRTEEALRESESRYRTLFNNAGDMIFIHDLSGHTIAFNQVACERLGYSRQELLDMTPMDIDAPEYATLVPERINELRQSGHVMFETVHVTREGKTIPTEVSARLVEYAGKPAVLSIARDITERKQAEDELRRREEELLVKAHNLKEVNTALRVLLKQRQEDKKDLEERVLSNLRELVFPYMEDLKKARLDYRQMSLLGVIESNLNGITTPFLRRLSSQYLSLTPREIQVAGLVREGRTTKEIAELLSSSTDAIDFHRIDFHRKNLRKKLGITNSKTNLRTHLLSLL
jgi:PAS domain S-box-containing protein